MSQSNIPNDNQVDLIYAANNTVGESIVWDVNNHRLLWVDIVDKKFMHSYLKMEAIELGQLQILSRRLDCEKMVVHWLA